MKILSALKLPREHGAWAMLYVPFILGITVAGRFTLPVLLLLVATTAFFVARESLLVWWRAHNRGRNNEHAGRLLLTYLIITALAGAPLILVYRLYWLLPLAALGAALLALNGKQATEFDDRTILSEMTAICGLTMTAPAAHYAASTHWTPIALGLWALSAAYFASSVFYIKLRVSEVHARRKPANQRARWQCIGYHAFLLVSLVALVLTASLPLFVLIAFAPAVTRALWGLLKPSRRLNLKRIGIAEIVYSLIFLIFVTLSFRSIY